MTVRRRSDDLAGEREGGGAAADHDGRPVLHERRRRARDRSLGLVVGIGPAALGHALGQRGAAVGADEAPLAGEPVEVAADRGGGHAQRGGQLGDAGPAVDPQLVDQARTALRLPHARRLRDHARIVKCCAHCAHRDGESCADLANETGPAARIPPMTHAAGSRAFDLLVVGEINPDVVVTDADPVPVFGQAERFVEGIRLVPGSSSVITAMGAARLGLRVAMVGVVGDDPLGRFMLEAHGRPRHRRVRLPGLGGAADGRQRDPGQRLGPGDPHRARHDRRRPRPRTCRRPCWPARATSTSAATSSSRVSRRRCRTCSGPRVPPAQPPAWTRTGTPTAAGMAGSPRPRPGPTCSCPTPPRRAGSRASGMRGRRPWPWPAGRARWP